MDLQLKGKVALVAAASKGLGLGIARELAREGARVCLGSRNRSEAESAAAALRQETDAEVLGLALDVIDPDSIERWIGNGRLHFGTIDCLVVNAGGPPAGKFDQFHDTDWQAAFNLTLLSAIRLIRGVLPAMREKGSGSIVVSTSSSVKEPLDNLILSNVLRSGVTSLAKSLSFELAPEGIRINNLVPGRIDTDRVRSLDLLASQREGISHNAIKARNLSAIPLGRYGSIEEYGKAATFLLSEAASYITGETLVVDGGSMRTVW